MFPFRETDMNRKLGVFALIALLAGCASEPVAITVNYFPTKNHYEPEPFVTVLNAPPSGTYVSIATLDATGAPGITKAQVIAALQQKAQALGANALIVSDESLTRSSAKPDL